MPHPSVRPAHNELGRRLNSPTKDREIATILGITLEAVKIQLHRARARLRKNLEQKCSFSRDSENTLVCDIKPLSPNS
jgi:DNA-directed RNA polymerase specialized sigma subunit